MTLAAFPPPAGDALATTPATASAFITKAAPDGRRVTHTLIVSDVHLGLSTSLPGKLLETLRAWQFDRLILLGDIFHDNRYHRFCPESWDLLRHIRDLAAARSAEVVWLNGNHDRHLAPVVAELTGIEVRESYAFEQGGRSFLAVHGDRFDWFNHNFTKLGCLIGRAYAFCLHRLSPDGHLSSRLAKARKRARGVDRRVARKAAAFAMREGFDVIVCGHTHRAGQSRFVALGRHAVTYVNSGSWVDLPASFLTIDASGVQINHAY